MKSKIISAVTISILFSMNTFAYTPPPKPPDYASCKLIDVADGGTNSEGNPVTTTHKVIEPGCKSSLDQQYQAGLRANAMANQLTTDANDNIIQPPKPEYRTCQNQTVNGDNSVPDYNCISENSQKQRAYNDKMNVYNMVVQQQNDAKAQQQSNVDAKIRGSATQSLADAEQHARQEGKAQDGHSQVFTGVSIAFGVAFAASCMTTPPGCNGYFAAASAAAAVMSALSAKQSNQDFQTADLACKSYNNIASDKKGCGDVPPPVDVTKPTFPYQQVDPATGTCLTTAPDTCSTNLKALTDKGVNIKKVLAAGPSGFAGPNTPFKMNPDGSVTMKSNGKTLTAADFKDQASMMAAGMSAAEAKALSNEMYGKDGMLAKAGLDAKADLKAMNSGMGSFDMGGSGTTSTVKIGAEDPNKGNLGTKDINGGAHGKRETASEGLVRNFNGDTIGIANDDIFKMMNKRYILKSAQDSFIGQ